MNQGLSIAASGLNAAMAEINATSENLANSQTVGYVSETAQLAAMPGGSANGVGGGVQVTTIAQATNALLSANNLQAQASLSSLGSLQQVLTGIENVFPLGQGANASSTSASSNTSLAGQLSGFWSAWDGIAQNPSSSAARTQVVNLAQGLVSSLGQASAQLAQLAGTTQGQIQTSLGQVNALLTQAASLNGSIVATTGAGASPNQLVDQLNSVLGQLSSLAGVNVHMQPNGTALVSIGGIAVVQGVDASTLATTSTTDNSVTPPTTTIGISAYTTAADAASGTAGVAAPVSGGALSGLLSGMNQYLPQYQGQLDAMAGDLAGAVNTQLAQGYDAAGAPGSSNPLFEQNGNPISAANPVTAAGLTVNAVIVSNPALIAAGGAQATDTGSVLAGGTVSSAETLTIVQSGTSVAYSTTAGESLASIASDLNGQFASAGLSLSASVIGGGTQLQLASSSSATASSFQVTSTGAGAGTTGLGGAVAGSPAASVPAPIGVNDASNAQAMAELGTPPAVAALASASGSTLASPDAAYQNLVEGIGSNTQNVNTQLASQTSVANQAQAALQAVSGVNSNTQLADLIQYQASYQASAKVVSIIDATMQSLLAAV